MKMNLKLFAFAILLAVATLTPVQSFAGAVTEPSLGKATAPLTIIEYASLTCSHCADFYTKVLPEIEKRYVDTGKVRFIHRDFPMDAYSLRAATLAHCMPTEQYYPFVRILFNNQASWLRAPKIEDALVKYAEMAGLPSDKAKACIDDTKMMDQLIAVQTEATKKYAINATPTFIIIDSDKNEDKIVGARSLEDFTAAIDGHLAKKK